MNSAIGASSEAEAPAAARLADTLHLGAVHLTVTDLDRSVAYYEQVIGLRERARDGDADTATLGTGGRDILVLTAESQARPAGRHAGLYHFALVFGSRVELARALARIADQRAHVDGASDHGTHEALYLRDPDGNGIELAADRPRDRWPDMRSPSGYGGGPQPLDVAGLMGLVAGEPVQAHAADDLRVGHMHLHVGDVERGVQFYCDVVGFELMVNLGSAAFVSVGGYHHHLAFNVWQGRGVGPAPPGTVGLRHWTIELDDDDQVQAVARRVAAAGGSVAPYDQGHGRGVLLRDPWEIAVAVTARDPAWTRSAAPAITHARGERSGQERPGAALVVAEVRAGDRLQAVPRPVDPHLCAHRRERPRVDEQPEPLQATGIDDRVKHAPVDALAARRPQLVGEIERAQRDHGVDERHVAALQVLARSPGRHPRERQQAQHRCRASASHHRVAVDERRPDAHDAPCGR